MRFTRKRCPTDHAIVERTHQTMTAQALLGQTYPSHAAMWAGLDERRLVLNRHLPSRALAHQAPIARLSTSSALGTSVPRLHGKKSDWPLRRCAAIWPRAAGSAALAPMGSFTRGAYHYYLGKRFAHRSVAIRFDPGAMVLLCQPEGSEDTYQMPIQGTTKAVLMGEFAELVALPMYQLALPFSVTAWRQLEYAHHLTGTTW